MSAPQAPIRELRFRLEKKLGTFVPCADKDPRGSLISNVDATGRHVQAIYASPFGSSRIVGWKYTANSDEESAADVVAWMQANPQLEAMK